REIFVSGAVGRGMTEKKARALFKRMEPFAQYGFNKSHSAAYAYLAYQTAFLKAHYPVEFITANLSADMGNTDKVVKLINECRKMNIEILPPDINESDNEFKISKNSVRFGLEALKGVGSSAIDAILNERDNAPFAGIDDFLSRTKNIKVNKRVVESLINAGAFDSLYNHNSGGDGAFNGKKQSENNIRYTRRYVRANAMHTFVSPPKAMTVGLFSSGKDAEDEVQPWDENRLLQNEKESLGFYLSGHPITRHRESLSALDVTAVSNIGYLNDREWASAAGVISEVKNRVKDKGVTAHLILEDDTGRCGVLVFPDIYSEKSDLLKKGSLVIIKGNVSKTEKETKLIAREIQDIESLKVKRMFEVGVKYSNEEETTGKLIGLRRLLNNNQDSNPDSKGAVTFKIQMPGYSVVISSLLNPAPNFAIEAGKITGERVKTLNP
ncbi:MAG: OB-fold nucleic acid binding domain-containing protein, partial [Nitrospirae bacterium]|nr:OB-fold nucleic acid binding domain-containing protein [Nitrospirota bacterium]